MYRLSVTVIIVIIDSNAFRFIVDQLSNYLCRLLYIYISTYNIIILISFDYNYFSIEFYFYSFTIFGLLFNLCNLRKTFYSSLLKIFSRGFRIRNYSRT